jgi:hypothetical protein
VSVLSCNCDTVFLHSFLAFLCVLLRCDFVCLLSPSLTQSLNCDHLAKLLETLICGDFSQTRYRDKKENHGTQVDLSDHLRGVDYYPCLKKDTTTWR